jgi:hypothetical protein
VKKSIEDRLSNQKNHRERTIFMQAPLVLWKQWHEQVKQLLVSLHGHQQKTLALMVLGIVLSGSAVLQRMAESVQQAGISEAKMPNIERRFARFVANERIIVPVIWAEFLRQVMPFFQSKQLSLVLDCTPFADRATLVDVGLLTHSRVLPLAWRVMPAQETWEQGQWELVGEMFDEITALLPEADCTLLADRGLTGMPLVQLCTQRHWHYRLRIAKEHTFRRRLMPKGQGKGKGQTPRWSRWTNGGILIQKVGQRWFGPVQLWQDETLETNLSAVWEPGHKEGWLIISDQKASPQRVNEYALRMRVEATFEDMKSRGWNLEASLITDRTRLNRLLLALFLALWWVSHLAASCIHHGQRDRFDRHDRRDKGIFRLGRLWLLDILKRAHHPASLKRCLPFKKQAHGWRFSLRF